jgi:flagellar basal body P-ring formation protein FlgA
MVKIITIACGICVFCLLGKAAPSQAAPTDAFEPPAAIRAAIETALASRLEAFKTANPEIVVGEIDSRLRLPVCPALTIGLPPGNAAAMTARVVCEAPTWTIYVPVRVHAWVPAVVAATNLAPNSALTAEDVTVGRVDAFASTGGLLTDPHAAEGKILRSSVAAGMPILSPLLDLPITVRRGQKVVLRLEDPAMSVKAAAVALEDGRVGQSIMVQNSDSKKDLRATVAEDGSVELKF